MCQMTQEIDFGSSWSWSLCSVWQIQITSTVSTLNITILRIKCGLMVFVTGDVGKGGGRVCRALGRNACKSVV